MLKKILFCVLGTLFLPAMVVAQGGLALTFDDNVNIGNWVEQIPLLEKYDAKVTFFINAPHTLSAEQIAGLKSLQAAGHDVGAHGWNHESAVPFLQKQGVAKWASAELVATNKALSELGFSPTAFAYPNGQRNELSDNVSKNYYAHACTGIEISEGKTLAEMDELFTPMAKVANRYCFSGKGCDNIDDTFFQTHLYPALERAKNRDELLVLSMHKIHPGILEKILQKTHGLGLKYYQPGKLPVNFGYATNTPKDDGLQVSPTIVLEGLEDMDYCWMQARADVIPGKDAILTLQKIFTRASDVYYALHNMTRKDGVWSKPKEQDGLGRFPVGGKREACPCDGTPMFHKKSGKMLQTGALAFYPSKEELPAASVLTAKEGWKSTHTYYAVYDAETEKWSELRILYVPQTSQYATACAGCTQRWDMEDGTVLLPVYSNDPDNRGCYHTGVIRCTFDGEKLEYKDEGEPLKLNSPRGLYEPSLIRFHNKFYLTLRNDTKGYVATSDDGMNFSTPIPWVWKENGQEIGSYNTQQHWIAGGGKLYLVYTRRAEDNGFVMRHRAPLFLAEMCLETLTLKLETERRVVPNRGGGLGNFGVAHISDNESWVVVSEWIHRGLEVYGDNNIVWLTKLEWR